MSVREIPYRAKLQASLITSHRKGLFLSHLLGAVLASEFVVGIAAGRTVPYVSFPLFTDWLDFPLRFIAVWLIIDRNWRYGRLKLGLWDFLALGFPLLVGLAYPFLALDPSVAADFDSYRRFLGSILRFYTIYLLMREGYNRAGFRGDIVIRWVLGALAMSAFTAVLQALNIGGVRAFTTNFYRLQAGVDYSETGFRARGFSAHWNGFASEMVMANILVLAPLNWRPIRWWEGALSGLYTVGLIVSTSRGGYGTMFIVTVAAGCYFLWTGRKRTGMVLLGLIGFAALTFGIAVMTIKLPLFHELLVPPKVRSMALGSLDYRMERANKLLSVAMDRPLTGTGPSLLLYDSPLVLYRSAASVDGVLDVSYSLIFAQFGAIGLLYIGGVIYSLVRFGARRRAIQPYALMAFLIGVAFAVDSLVEIIFITQPMILVSIAAACAASRVTSYSKELAGRRFSPALPQRVHAKG